MLLPPFLLLLGSPCAGNRGIRRVLWVQWIVIQVLTWPVITSDPKQVTLSGDGGGGQVSRYNLLQKKKKKNTTKAWQINSLCNANVFQTKWHFHTEI